MPAAAAVVPTRFAGPFGPIAVTGAVVLLVNAFNMLDGLDALAAGVALVAAAGDAVLLRGDARSIALAVAGALAGFLWWNRPPARVYLGDAGAYLLGAVLVLLLASAWRPGESAGVGFGALALVALPVIETGLTVTRRLRAGHPLFEGDRGHVYDQLVDRGWSVPRASVAFASVELFLAVVAALVMHAAAAIAFAVVAATLGLLVAVLVVAGFTRPEFRSRMS